MLKYFGSDRTNFLIQLSLADAYKFFRARLLQRLKSAGWPAECTGDSVSTQRNEVLTEASDDEEMSFRQPFRAVPIKLGERYRRKARSAKQKQVMKFLGGAALLGAVVGIGSVVVTPAAIQRVGNQAKPLAVSMGIVRARAPIEGDHWSDCTAARSAGTAPIYRGEPGYREGMDGDGDGVACEPYY